MEGLLVRGWDHIPPGRRWVLALQTSGMDFDIVRGGIDPGDNHVHLRHVGVVDVWKDLLSENCALPFLGVGGRTNWGLNTVRGVIDSGDHRFRPRLVECVYLWMDSLSGGGTLSSPGGVASTNPTLGFPHRGGRYRPERTPFLFSVCWSYRCMEGFLILGWGVIFTGWRWLHERQVGVSIPSGAVSTRGTNVLVPGLLTL